MCYLDIWWRTLEQCSRLMVNTSCNFHFHLVLNAMSRWGRAKAVQFFFFCTASIICIVPGHLLYSWWCCKHPVKTTLSWHITYLHLPIHKWSALKAATEEQVQYLDHLRQMKAIFQRFVDPDSHTIWHKLSWRGIVRKNKKTLWKTIKCLAGIVDKSISGQFNFIYIAQNH